ncbi:cytochrome o ubiquinol oxidase subunit IV [Salinicola sp. JS01]|uniref:cytochrome o ubiquinol oxidase subunit IV n=1 Tax=Salinicola sp. JS01 TaxID=3050071 RepID=UPI00255C05A6|nr:cytochrome o ubiquinol oxidase subunit IV [Salinicola sp. JS01]WIX34673.1 cytochrome o ubiquinol oxidase subunit IV [Salinicola sp. JS01]
MSDIHTSHDGASHGSYKSYFIGLVLSIVLTLIAFGVVMAGGFSVPVMMVTVVVTAIAQVLVQLVLFMHLNTKAEGGWNFIAIVFTIGILGLIIGGSLWIMHNIHVNMMLN